MSRSLRMALPALLIVAIGSFVDVDRPADTPTDPAHPGSVAPLGAAPAPTGPAAIVAEPRRIGPSAIPGPRRLGVEALPSEGAERLVIQGEVLVTARPAEAAHLSARLEQAGFAPRAYAPGLATLRVALPAGMSVAEGLERVAEVPGARPSPNALAWAIDARAASLDGEPDPSLTPWSPTAADWEMARDMVLFEQSPTMVDRAAMLAARAVDLPLVAVLDTGVGYRSAVLPRGPFVKVEGLSATHFEPGWNFVHGDDLPLDDHMHGSHVTSTLLTAAARDARVMPVKVLDWQALGSEFDVAQGLEYAVDNGAHVINLSLTFGPGYVPSATMLAAVDKALAAGVVLVAGSGNAGAATVAHPAAFEGVIAVGALDGPDTVAVYSNHGGALDLVAAGGGLPEAQHGVAAAAFDLHQPTRGSSPLMSGTSVSSAQVAGQIAGILAEVGIDSADEVTETVLSTPRALRPAPFDTHSGLGTIDTEHAARTIIVDRIPDPKSEDRPYHRPTAYPMVFIESLVDGVRGVGLIELMDTDGRAMAHTEVYGDWLGSAPGSARCTTDDFGRCVVETPTINPGAESPVFGLIVHRVVAPQGTPLRVRPGSRIDAAGAGALNDAMITLRPYMAAGTYPKSALVVLGESDPVTGAPLYCLATECPVNPPAGTAPADVFAIDYQSLMTITRIAGGLVGADSLMAGRHIAETFTVRRLGRAFEGSGLTVAFDAAFKDALIARLGPQNVFYDDNGLRLASDGAADPLMWVNDVDAAELAGGVGMVISGMYTGPNMQAPPIGLWAAERFYKPAYEFNAGGVGMVISGMMVGVMDTQTFWDINEMQFDHDWDGFGIGMVISGMSPPPVFDLPYFQPPFGGFDPDPFDF